MATPRASRGRNRWLQPVTITAAVLPAVWIGIDGLRGRLGADPISSVLNRLGWWTIVILLASLACTPARILLRTGWPGKLRRTLGLCAFFYALTHFVFYVGVDQYFDWRTLWADVVKRKFMTIGFAALCLLVPLALTSTKESIRRLGGKRWTRLHQLVYPAAILAVIHFIWRVKADRREPYIFGAVLLALFAVRIIHSLVHRKSAPSGSARSRVGPAADRTPQSQTAGTPAGPTAAPGR